MTTDTRIGNWLGLDGTGRRFYPLDPRPEDVTIEDIAHALSNVCRWGGRVREFLSVAQHSVHVAQIVERTRPDLALHALLHDAAETYLGDLPTPIKEHIAFRYFDSMGRPCETSAAAVEFSILEAVMSAVGSDIGPWLFAHNTKTIKAADALALATEARDLMGGLTWPGMVETSEPTIEPLSPRAARAQFLSMFRRLTAKA